MNIDKFNYLEALEREATIAPWHIHPDKSKWVTNDVLKSDWADNRDNDAKFVSEARNAFTELLRDWHQMRFALMHIAERGYCDSAGTAKIATEALRGIES
jgi:hypothetical protein